MVVSDFDLHLLYEALDEERARRGMTWSDVAREIEQSYAKVSRSTIKGVRDRERVEGDGVLQMLLWLGRSPESFIPGSENRDDERLIEPKSSKVLRWDTKPYTRLWTSGVRNAN